MPGGKWLATASTLTFIITVIVICPAAVWPGPPLPSLSSLFLLTQELFQNPNLNYLFWTLNSTHTYNWLKTAGYVYP